LGKLVNTFAIQQHLIFYIVTTSRKKVNKHTLWAYVCNKHSMLYNSILLFSSITDIYAKLNSELGYFKFNHKVFIIRAYFNNFKMFVSSFLKIIRFYPNCKPHMYAVLTHFLKWIKIILGTFQSTFLMMDVWVLRETVS